MNRLRITRSQPFVKYLMAFIALFCIYIITRYPTDSQTVLIAGAIAIVCLIIAYRSYYASIIEFDDENMYVRNKRTDDVIPLKNVSGVKLTAMEINRSHFWKICYYDSANDEKAIRILPIYKNLSLFMDKVKEKNPDVEIKDSIGIFG
jgi:hypothetical protein